MIDTKRAREICEAATTVLPICCVANCPNDADPRFGIPVGDVYAAACDGHESYTADRYLLRDPLPRWPLHRSQREKLALEILPQALDEIDRLRALAREACEIGQRVVADVQVLPSTDHDRLAAILASVEGK